MKKIILQLLTIGLLLICLFGCGGVSQNDYDTLRTENENLKKQIEDLKFGPEKLLSLAKVFIDKEDFINGKAELHALISKHPTSQQITEAKQLLLVVDNAIKLQNLEKEKEKAEKEKKEKERLANATRKMNNEYDEIKEISWYRDKSSPKYVNSNGFYAYIGQSKDSKPWLILALQYSADDWLFIESYTIKVDGKIYTIKEESYGEIKKDNGSGRIWEWLSRPVGPDEYEIIKAVAYGKDVKIRFSGKDYHKDKVITEQQKNALKNVLDAYEALGGDVNIVR